MRLDVAVSDDDGYKRAAWLIEPRRASCVTKFTGTLGGPPKTDADSLPLMTALAFVHFAYLYSKRTVLFADVQGMFLRPCHIHSIMLSFNG